MIFPYLNGVDALTAADPDRFVIDFEQMNQLEPRQLFRVRLIGSKRMCLPDRERKAKEGIDKDGNMRPHHKAFLSRWWQLSFGRPEMLSVIKPIAALSHLRLRHQATDLHVRLIGNSPEQSDSGVWLCRRLQFRSSCSRTLTGSGSSPNAES